MNDGSLSYRQYDTLKAHELTIVQMKFSNDGKHLLSVSRDRSWKLFSSQTDTKTTKDAANDNEPVFRLVKAINSKNNYHTRIIWSCDWSHDDRYFVTTSRDKRACIWHGVCKDTQSSSKLEHEQQLIECKPVASNNGGSEFLELHESITACSFAPCLVDSKLYSKFYFVLYNFNGYMMNFFLFLFLFVFFLLFFD
jgi:elongator complex protein 2